MRITYLHQYFNTPSMAGGTRSYELGRRLVSMGHNVDVITTWRADTERRGWFTTQEAGMDVHWLPVPYSNQMSYARRLQAFATFACAATERACRLRGDVIYATSTPLTIAVPALIARRWTRRPMVFEVRDSWPTVPVELGALRDPLSIAAARCLERSAYFGAKHVVALSPAMKDDVVSTGYPASKVSVIPNGCDLELFPVGSGTVQQLHQSHPWVEQRPLLVYTGALGRMNGVGFLVRLAVALRRHGDPFTIAVIGDGSERSSLERHAASEEVLDHTVRFIGSIPKSQVGAWLNASVGTLMTLGGPPSIARYAVQNKFFDYIAAGRPVISNFRGYVSEVAEECGAGLIVSADPSDAAKQIMAQGTRDWLKVAGLRARQLAEERFAHDAHACQLAELLAAVHAEGHA